MALTTGSFDSPVLGKDTPTLDTDRTAAIRAAVRAEIEPKGRWWDFEFRPWHYWTAIGSTAVTTGIAVLLIATHGGAR